MNTPMISIDTETTGLHLSKGHVVTEIALVVPDENFVNAITYEWFFELTPEELEKSDEEAMQIQGYYMKVDALRDSPIFVPSNSTARAEAAAQIAAILNGAVIAGMNVGFDADFTAAFLKANGQEAKWNYHMFEIESACVGYLGKAAPYPWRSSTIAKAMGIDLLPKDRVHGALEDAVWNCKFLKTLREHTTPHLRFIKGGKNVE